MSWGRGGVLLWSWSWCHPLLPEAPSPGEQEQGLRGRAGVRWGPGSEPEWGQGLFSTKIFKMQPFSPPPPDTRAELCPGLAHSTANDKNK